MAMNWREALGVTNTTDTPSTHNTHNTQKALRPTNCADIAEIVHSKSEEVDSMLLEVLADACQGLTITPVEVREALAPQDIEEWCKGNLSNANLATYAQLLVERRERDQGKRPACYTKQAICKNCGPIWLWISGEVLSCPWCWNRAAGKPIPRPHSIQCGDCMHFERIDHPHLGHCKKDQPEASAGNWDDDGRCCDFYCPG
jgi:hypothetical protein